MQEKLIFYYSAMKGGKTSRIFSKIHDLEENGQIVLLIKPAKDTKGEKEIINRKGEHIPVDILLGAQESLLSQKYFNELFHCDHIIVDEAEFITPEQATELWEINKKMNIPITCFGLKGNFKSELFSGTARLIALADEITEMDTNSLCLCGAPAKFNARKVDGEFTMEGEEVVIDGSSSNVEYVPLCGGCFYKKVYSKGKMKKCAQEKRKLS